MNQTVEDNIKIFKKTTGILIWSFNFPATGWEALYVFVWHEKTIKWHFTFLLMCFWIFGGTYVYLT